MSATRSRKLRILDPGPRPQARRRWLPWLVLGVAVFALPPAARADIYKWTDAEGRTVVSNLPPDAASRARNVEVLAKDVQAAVKLSAPAKSTPARTATEQALLDRIDALERELQAQRYQPPPPAPVAYTSYYSPPPAPAPMPYYGSYYPAPSYYYPAVPYYSAVIYPTRPMYVRPAIRPAHGFGFRGGGHRGRR